MPKSTTPPIAKYWTAPTAENILSHLHSANDMNIHRLLLVFYLLQETDLPAANGYHEQTVSILSEAVWN
jgi:hypothetical protein